MRHGRLKESKQVGQPDTDKGLTRNNKEHKTVLPPTFTSLLSSTTKSMNNGLWLLWLLQKLNKTSKIRKNFKSWITLRYKREILLLAYFIILWSSLAWILWPSHLPHPHQGICADFFFAIEILTELGEQAEHQWHWVILHIVPTFLFFSWTCLSSQMEPACLNRGSLKKKELSP